MNDDVQRGTRGTRRANVYSASSASSASIVVLAVVFLALHLPYLPQSLEDLDSINFALGVRQFDVAHHQPHPPGYPVFVLLAKAVHAVVPSEASSLALVSVGGGALGVLALAALFRRLDEASTPLPWRVAPVAVATTAPLYWFTAVRPLSDSSGLAAALAVQAMTLAAGSTRGLAAAAFCAGLATGIRSQIAWLTVPLLIFAGLSAQGSGLRAQGAGRKGTWARALSPQPLALMALAFGGGAIMWFVPLLILSGGPSAYWHALFDQGAEDLGNIQMLWTMHGARDVRDALYYAFVAPWAAWPIAAAALIAASAGLVRMVRRQRRALRLLAVAFGPYLLFDLLFQETFTSRYALPLVVPMAYLAVHGLRMLPWDTGLACVVAIAMFSAHVGGTSIAAFSRAKAPAFRLLDDMGAAPASPAPVLAMDRRESFDLRRPIKWAGAAMPQAQMLPAPPQHEWLEAVKYWNGDGRAPVWFVVDPMRASIDLIQHGDPTRYRWALPYPVLLSGVRPDEMDWYRVDRPEWYVGEGWALTPETAGVADADRRGPSLAPIEGWIHRRVLGGALMIGGRSFDPALKPRLTVRVEGRVVAEPMLAPGPFMRFVTLPADLLAPGDPRAYARVTVDASAGARVAIEQFDASATRSMVGFGEGWHEQELNPRTGVRWRWLSQQGTLRMRLPLTRISLDRLEAPEVVLHIEGESPLTYFPRGSMLTVRSGWRVQLTRPLNSDFALDVPITDLGPAGESDITLQTDQTYVPAERSSRTQDRRHLGLRIFKAELRTVKPPVS